MASWLTRMQHDRWSIPRSCESFSTAALRGTSRHRPLPRPRRPAHPALHPRQAAADCAAGGAEAGIIHQAVTGQIDVRTGQPYPVYMPSGVEWLGDVPEHWEVKKLRQCGTVAGGVTPSMENRRFWDGAIPWITPKDMKREAICDSSMRVAEAAIHETSLRLIDPPAVLMVVRGMILARRVPIAWITAL